MTDKMANTSSSFTTRSPKATAAAAAALSTMIALNVCPVQAFQPTFLVPSARMMHRSPAFSNTVAPAGVRMDCTPWDLECYGVHPLAGVGGLQRRRRMQQQRPGFPPIFAPANVFQDSSVQTPEQLVISDPTVVQDTADLYTLAFDLPADVDQDGLEVSVSGRLLTIKARTTREESTDPSASRSGWVTRSSRTDSVSRSFVLPEGLSASSATASLLSDGKAEVKFTKDKTVDGAAAGDPSETTAPSMADSIAPDNKTDPSAEHVASSSSAPPTDVASAAGGATATGGDAPAAAGAASASPPTDSSSPAAERPSSRPGSPFEVLDPEFLEFAKAMWGEEMLDILRVPTQEELAERAEAAKEARAKRAARMEEMAKAAEEARAKRQAAFAERIKAAEETRAKRQAEFAERVKAAEEARAKRVVAMRRATMASDISRAEDGSSYVVRVALPEGTAREDVKLTVNPDNSLRVTASAPTAKGGPSMYKNVFLPKDALTSEISAKFEAEESNGQEDSKEDAGVATGVDNAGAVSGVEVTVGRTIPPQPKSIEIL